MTRRGSVIGSLVGLLGLVLLWWGMAWNSGVVLDLVDELPVAVEQRPRPDVFRAMEIPVNGVRRKAIYVAEPSRLVYRVDVPKDAWLCVDFGVREEAWPRPNPGVLFVVSIRVGGPGRLQQEVVSVVANPFANPQDRQWLPVQVDLNPWAGQSVDVILETRPPVPGGDVANHLALWGAPALVVR